MTPTGLAVRTIAALLLSAPAFALPTGPATSVGPGRIICKSAAACELRLGAPAKLKYRINATALSDADKARLIATCTAKAKTPCLVTVQGTEMGDAVKIKAAKITFHN